jgi:hypothetical protein
MQDYIPRLINCCDWKKCYSIVNLCAVSADYLCFSFFLLPGIRTTLVLDEDARPAELQSCHPKGDSRYFFLRHTLLAFICSEAFLSGYNILSYTQCNEYLRKILIIFLDCRNSRIRF